MKEVKVIMLIVNSLALAWLLTDYNIFQYTFISDLFLVGLSICWIKCFDLVIDEEEKE
jgi:energy-converting hydrogenase Eha subunit H